MVKELKKACRLSVDAVFDRPDSAAALPLGVLGALFYAGNVLHTTDLMANNITFYTNITAHDLVLAGSGFPF